MDAVNAVYTRFLAIGFVVLKQAFYSKDLEWLEAEIELLHNIPSLINEPNIERHRCFWTIERDLYVEKINSMRRDEPKTRMMTYYEPLWEECESVIQEYLLQKDTKVGQGAP